MKIFWILCLVLWIVSKFAIGNKKKAGHDNPTPRVEPKPWEQEESPELEEEEVFGEEEVFEEAPQDAPFADFSEKSAKDEQVFTYDSLMEGYNEAEGQPKPYPVDNVEKSVQPIENEQEKKSGISVEIDDLRKGIIYSEILKRPDF